MSEAISSIEVAHQQFCYMYLQIFIKQMSIKKKALLLMIIFSTCIKL
jgi:hypothetical protein